MAGMNKILRTHKHNTSKPSFPVVDKSIGCWLGNGNQQANVGLHIPYFNFMENRGFLCSSATSTHTVLHVKQSNRVKKEHVVIGSNVLVYDNSKKPKCRIHKESQIKNANLANSIPDNFVIFEGKAKELNIDVITLFHNFESS